MNKLNGYRGYVGSRPYACGDYPQFIQNLIIRNYCEKNKINYLLSATEYCMPGCYMMLQDILNNLHAVDGIVLFSIFMLPASAQKRKAIYDKVLSANKSMYAALEDLSLSIGPDINKIEDIFLSERFAHTDASINMLLDAALS